MIRGTARRRLIQGFGANVVGKGITATIRVVSIPVFLAMWGPAEYGEWLILTSIAYYFSVGDLGFSTAAANEMTMLVSKGDRMGALRVLQSTWLLISGLSVVVAAIGLAAVFILPIASWFGLLQVSTQDATVVLGAMLIYVLVGLQLGLVDGVYRCDGRYARGRILADTLRFAEFAALVLVLVRGGGPAQLALSLLAVRVAGLLLLRWDLHRRVPWITFGFRLASLDTIKGLVRPAIAFVAFPLAYALDQGGMILVVGIVLGPIAVASMAVVRTAVNFVRQLMDIMNATVWPELSIAFGAGRLDVARRLHRLACKMSLWLGVVLLAGLSIFGLPLLGIWTGGLVEVDPAFFRLMLAAMTVKVFWFTSSIVPIAINLHERLAVLYLSGVVASLVFVFLAAPYWGLISVGVALLVVDIGMSVYVLPSSLRLVGDAFRPYVVGLVSPRWSDLLRSPSSSAD